LFGRQGWTTLVDAPDIWLALDTEQRVTPCSQGATRSNIVDMADRIHGSESTRIITEAGPRTQSDWQWLTSVGTGQKGALVVCPLSFDLGEFSQSEPRRPAPVTAGQTGSEVSRLS
jgi:hypothetical protein